ncbi:flagellar biosynthetic protein FliR [Oceanimonas baumannii]|uniref:Flagellar biosynthetic protein FliR n=1 Tax=Oceanimonas baumannii TaxID=129578 RepID=A0A235CMH0_9GAMM|nr:flagellar biosynthetic protein FliR [Oceanimonas baumannii]OYD25768.1 flagellar biosynthetic protein FliR [Oceanimonas baumannii]TDW60225.1 flagellar biosynthetic protein FliR [Oceanimonas baumannii]
MTPLLSLTTPELMAWIGKGWWPFCRLAAFFWVLPLFGDGHLSPQIRLLFAFVLAMVLMPLLPKGPEVDPFSFATLVITLEQLLFGALLALMLQLLFTVVTMAGQILSMQMGLAMAVMNDPVNGGSAPLLGQLLWIFVALLFLAWNGHLLALDVIVESFRRWPVGHSLTELDLSLLINLAGWMFGAALLLALPAVIAMLLVNITFGVMNRSAPSLNIFALGFPMTMMLGLVSLLLMLANIPQRYLEFSQDVFELMRQWGS